MGYHGTPGERVAIHIWDCIAADRKDLNSLMARLKITQSAPRKAAAWLSEKFAEIKVRLDDLHEGSLRRLELWEALSVGIEGKRLLWVSLGSVVDVQSELAVIDLAKQAGSPHQSGWHDHPRGMQFMVVMHLVPQVGGWSRHPDLASLHADFSDYSRTHGDCNTSTSALSPAGSKK